MPKGVDTVLTVDGAGRISADFTGHVHAQGLDLDAGDTTSPPEDRKVRWIRVSDGAVIADLESFSAGGTNRSTFITYANLGETATTEIKAVRGSSAKVDVIDNGTTQGVYATAGGSSGYTIVDSDKRSSFLQIQPGVNRKSAAGTDVIAFGATAQAAAFIPHGLGVAPSQIYVTAKYTQVAPLNVPTIVSYGAMNAVNFTVVGRFADAVARTENISISWIAVE